MENDPDVITITFPDGTMRGYHPQSPGFYLAMQVVRVEELRQDLLNKYHAQLDRAQTAEQREDRLLDAIRDHQEHCVANTCCCEALLDTNRP